jgi:hypothetical protein
VLHDIAVRKNFAPKKQQGALLVAIDANTGKRKRLPYLVLDGGKASFGIHFLEFVWALLRENNVTRGGNPKAKTGLVHVGSEVRYEEAARNIREAAISVGHPSIAAMAYAVLKPNETQQTMLWVGVKPFNGTQDAARICTVWTGVPSGVLLLALCLF